MSSNWPTLSSIRSSFHTLPRLRRGAGHQLVGVARTPGRRPGSPRPRRTAAPRPPSPPAACVAGEHGVRRRRAAPAGGVVHHVVVEQGEGVHQLERGAGVDHDAIVGRVAAGADEAPVAERRPQPLAARQHQPPDLVERLGEVGVERRPPRRSSGSRANGVDASRRFDTCARRDRGASSAERSAGTMAEARRRWLRRQSIGRGVVVAVEVGDHLVDLQPGGRRSGRGTGRSARRPGRPGRRAGRRRRRRPPARAGCASSSSSAAA